MSVLNRWGLIQSPSQPSDLPIVKGSWNPQLKIKIFSTDWDHFRKHSMSTQKKKMQSSQHIPIVYSEQITSDDVAIQG